MDTKKLAASLTTAFAFATGAGTVAAAEPVQASPKVDVIKSATSNFNDHSKAVVFQRNLERDFRTQPILMKQENGRYLVHEPTLGSSLFGGINGERTGSLKSYSKDDLEKAHGPVDQIQTFDQFKKDAEVLRKTPGLGPKLSDVAFDMGTRLDDIKGDMKAAGETFQPAPRKSELHN